MITRPDTAVDMVLRAYKTAITGRPGPVVVQIPFDIQHSETLMEDLERAKKMVEICPPGPDAGGIKEAAKLIAKAERPMVFVSSGIHNSAAFAELATLVESFGLPIATTTMGKEPTRKTGHSRSASSVVRELVMPIRRPASATC